MKKSFLILAFLVFGYTQAQENIVLNFPEDGDTIYTYNPMLTWYLMGDILMNNSREFYRITVVELQNNQDAASGVLMNTPLVRMDHLTQFQILYPYDAPALQEGIRYGWQIHKIMNNVIVGSSEAWEFIIGVPPVITPVYYKMKLVQDGALCHADNGKFYFEIAEAYNSEALIFKLFNEENTQINAQAKFNREDGELAQEINVKRTGFNQYELNFGSAVPVGIYKLVVWDTKNRKYELSFKVD